MWEENNIWYPATCICANQQSVEFRWIDPGNYAETGSTDLEKVRHRIVGSFEIAAGTPIYVKWADDGSWYPAKLLSKLENNIRFEWESRGDWEDIGTVELSHVRIIINEVQAINPRLNPMLLPSEDAVRRFTKDISTSERQESASTRSELATAKSPFSALALCRLSLPPIFVCIVPFREVQ